MGGIHIFLCLFFLCYIISLSNAFGVEIFTSSKALGEALNEGKDLGGVKAFKAATGGTDEAFKDATGGTDDDAFKATIDAIDNWILKPYDTYDKIDTINKIIAAINQIQGGSGDSVLAVNQKDYINCNINDPITKTDDHGTFDTSRPIYFIAANKPNCDQGQKFALVVISDSPADSPPPPSFAATTMTPSVAVVASVWVVTSLALGSFVTTY